MQKIMATIAAIFIQNHTALGGTQFHLSHSTRSPVTSSVPMATLPTLASRSTMSKSCALTSGVAAAIFGPMIGMITELAPPAMNAAMWMTKSSPARMTAKSMRSLRIARGTR